MYLETKELFVEPRRSAPLEVRAEPFTLEHLISWLEATPDDEYAFGNTEDGERGWVINPGDVYDADEVEYIEIELSGEAEGPSPEGAAPTQDTEGGSDDKATR